MTALRVTHSQVRRSGDNGLLCVRGIRAWYAQHGLDYAELVARGTPADVLEATGDVFALRAVDIARQEASSGQG